MPNFCTTCSSILNIKENINVNDIFKKLMPGGFKAVKCDCCGLSAIFKTDEFELKVVYMNDDYEQELILVDYV